MTTAQQTSQTGKPPAPIRHHWIVTVQFDNGRQAATYDGSVDVTSGSNTRSSVYADLRKHMGQVIGTDRFVVLFFSLTPDQI
jgi:hypothetical protein